MAEYQLKARWVSYLPEYVLWPPSSRQGHRQLTIGVIGDSPFENHLNEIFPPGDAQSSKSRLIYLKNYRALESCDVIFICQSESEQLYEILRRVNGRPVLTLGDSPDFARRGVMINLVLDQDRVGLEVNLPSLRLSGLEVTSHILKNAKIIE